MQLSDPMGFLIHSDRAETESLEGLSRYGGLAGFLIHSDRAETERWILDGAAVRVSSFLIHSDRAETESWPGCDWYTRAR